MAILPGIFFARDEGVGRNVGLVDKAKEILSQSRLDSYQLAEIWYF